MYRLCLLAAFFIASAQIHANDPTVTELLPGLRDRTVVLEIHARVLEPTRVVIWSETHERITIPGNPVNIRLVGYNIVLALQFTPFIRARGENILVAQGQIWIEIPNEGFYYHTSIQTISLEYNEAVYFFPLGSDWDKDMDFIEIMLTMKQYEDDDADSVGTIAPESAGSY